MLGGLDFHSVLALFARAMPAFSIGGIGVLDSVAALKALSVPNAPVTYLVRGFAAAGDGGGGFYWWNAADVTADNGGTIIQLNAGGNGRFNKLF